MTSIEISVRVYIEDTDAGGIVYSVNYLKFMERARSELMRELGYRKAALFDDALKFVVHSMELRYHAPAQLDDLLSVTASIVKVGRAFVVFEQTVQLGTQLLCAGHIKVACVGRDDGKPQPLPAGLIAALAANEPDHS